LDDVLREAPETDAGSPTLLQRGLARLRAASGTGPDPAALAGELFAVADLLSHEFALRRALADPGSDPEARRGLLDRVLGGQISATALDLLRPMVNDRWSKPVDLEDAVDVLGVDAELSAAEAQGVLETVEDELFRFGRIVDGNSELSLALSDTTLPAARKRGLIERLLTDKAQPVTIRLVSRVAVRAHRGTSLDRRLENLVTAAAARRARRVATIRVAQPLSADQADRLRQALSRSFGGDIQLQVEVDPSVLGGAVVRIGDDVVDGSVARRLAEASRLLRR
jgi:F-type H+-transporting ATPase subunit delta